MKVEWQQLLNEAITNPGCTSDTYNRFHPYSFQNRVLLQFQGLNEPVASYKIWQKLGRQVRKGEKASFVWKPIKKKNKTTNKEDICGFFIGKGPFGISQTDGPELEIPEIPEWNKDKALSTFNIKEVPFENNNGNIQGYAKVKENEIAINPVAKYPLKTLLHEIAHKVMKHTESNGITEFQAETVAYILMHELKQNWNADESRAYIQNWLKDHTPTEDQIKPVFSTVEKILKAGV